MQWKATEESSLREMHTKPTMSTRKEGAKGFVLWGWTR